MGKKSMDLEDASYVDVGGNEYPLRLSALAGEQNSQPGVPFCADR